jgi:mRNA interferase MazF
MGVSAAGQVVTVPFPYSDLSGQKLRPVLLVASAGYNDWVICQITSNPYADALAIPLTASSFLSAGLRHTSYARPSKLFTANESLITAQIGVLKDAVLQQIRENVITVIRSK